MCAAWRRLAQGIQQMSSKPSSGRAWGSIGKPVPYSAMLPMNATPGSAKTSLPSTAPLIGVAGEGGVDGGEGVGAGDAGGGLQVAQHADRPPPYAAQFVDDRRVETDAGH